MMVVVEAMPVVMVVVVVVVVVPVVVVAVVVTTATVVVARKTIVKYSNDGMIKISTLMPLLNALSMYPRLTPEAMVQAMDHEIKESAEANSFEKHHERKDVLSTKITKVNAGLPEENEKSEVQEMDDNKELSSLVVDKEHPSPSAPQPSDQDAEMHCHLCTGC
ncbi:hypothetical protein E2542_SST11228 [Spatholobus suberectus]|nr:hypothetical protein E2542_SST11228 [Spatholobus suberectus]